jgi:hypothetical protein
MGLKWTRNGKEILAGGFHNGGLRLWSYDVEQGKAWQLFPSPAILGSPSPDGSKMAIEIRDGYGSIWLAQLDPADSMHEAVRSAITEEQYLRRSCRDIRRQSDRTVRRWGPGCLTPGVGENPNERLTRGNRRQCRAGETLLERLDRRRAHLKLCPQQKRDRSTLQGRTAIRDILSLTALQLVNV